MSNVCGPNDAKGGKQFALAIDSMPAAAQDVLVSGYYLLDADALPVTRPAAS